MSVRLALSSAKLKTIKVSRVSVATFLSVAPVLLAVVLPASPARATPTCGATMPGGAASDWLGGSGVDVYSNGADENTGYDCVTGTPDDPQNYVGSVNTGYMWQCVEMVNRLFATKGWITSHWKGYGQTLVNNPPPGVSVQSNGHISSITPGDAVTFSDGGFGHAGIVDTVSANSFTFISQNAPVDTTVYLHSGSLAGGDANYSAIWSTYNMQAIMHSSSNTGASPTPSYQTSSNSGVVVTESAAPSIGFTQVFTQGPNNSLSTSWETPGTTTWSTGTVGASSGTTYSTPSATVTQSARTYGSSSTPAGFTQVFVEGPNNSLQTYWETPGASTWSGPLTIGATSGTTYSAPAAVVNQTTGLTQVFVEGPNNELNTYWTNVGQPWSGPLTIGAANTTYSAPSATVTEAATAAPAGFTQVFAQGASNSLDDYWATPGTTTWSAGTLAGSGTTYSAPAAVVTQKATSYTAAGFTQVFAEGSGNSVATYWATPGTTTYSAGTIPGSSAYSDPTATVTEPTTATPAGFTQVFTEGASNSLGTYWATPGYTSWSVGSVAVAGTTYSAPAGVVTQTAGATPAGFTHVFAQGASNSLNDYWATPGTTTWSAGSVRGGGTTYSAP